MFVLMLMISAAAQAQIVTNSASTPGSSNTLAIYLLAEKRGHKLDKLKLEAAPVLADRDFVWFNTNNHQFAIKVEAAKRLGRRLNEGLPVGDPWVGADGVLRYDVEGSDTPFVLMASGERIYVGMFSSEYSSSSYSSLPVVKTWQGRITADFTNDVVFYSEFDGTDPYAIAKFVEKNPQIREFGYGPLPDPRDDQRIPAAVRKLFGNRSHTDLP
jgi:hypothetical protein